MSKGRHRQPRPRRAARAGAAVFAGLGIAVLSTAWTGAAADAPVKYGWWSATNAGAPLAPPPPPDVPAKGLYVANGFSGPTAIAALSFAVPTGATVGALTLTTTGTPVMNTPPIACAVTAAGRGYHPADNGDWSAKPAYDCKAGEVKGAASSDGKTVSFPVLPLVRAGSLDVVILATGQADRIPFAPPDAGALAVTRPTSTTAGATTTGTSAGGAYGGQAASRSGANAAPVAAPAAAAAMPPPSTAGVTTTSGADTGVPPTVAGPQSSPGTSGAAGSPLAGARPTAAQTGSSTQHAIATGLGLAAVIGALLFWTEGFGLLGGRVASLAGRRSGPVYPDEPTIIAASAAAKS